MYSFYEIRKIFSRCISIPEVLKAATAFESVIEDNGFNEAQKNFTIKEEHIRIRQIVSINRNK